MTGDQLRILWTAFGLASTVIGVVAFGIMVWLMLDARRTDLAVAQVRPQLRIHTEAQVNEQIGLTVATGVLLSAALATFGAGVASIAAQAALALGLLVALEVLLLVAMVTHIILGLLKLRRRQQLAQIFRLTDPKGVQHDVG